MEHIGPSFWEQVAREATGPEGDYPPPTRTVNLGMQSLE